MKIFGSVPNFSTSDENVMELIISTMKEYGANILDVNMDRDHNRSVVTMISDYNNILSVLFNMAKRASELIDMDNHRGLHPRIGAIDVLPIIPMMEATMDEAIEMSKALGKMIGDNLNIPVYMYGNSTETKKRISWIRNMHFQYEELKKHINEEKYMPDFGPPRMGKAGAVMVGARNIMIAYNVNINTEDASAIDEITKKIRSGKYIKNVRALTFNIKSNKYMQISMNIYDYHDASLYDIYEFIKKESDDRGFSIAGSEIIGLLPDDAVAESLGYYLKSKISSKNILEYNILRTLWK